MAINLIPDIPTLAPLSEDRLLHSLVPIAASAASAQLDAFVIRLSGALLHLSESTIEAKEANLAFNSARILKKNGYAFYYLASGHIEKALQRALQFAEPSLTTEHNAEDAALSLVSYAEIDRQLLLGSISRPIEHQHADQMTALDIRIAHLLGRSEMTSAQNPFRPAVFIQAVNDAWCEFSPDPASHCLVLPLLRPEVFFDLAPILQALNHALIAHGILPELTDSYRIRKSGTHSASERNAPGVNAAVLEQLQRLLSPNQTSLSQHPGAGMCNDGQARATGNQLLGYLADIQDSLSIPAAASSPASDPQHASLLAGIKSRVPQGTLSQVDENVITLLSKIFDVVFRDRHIPAEIKALIGFLQVPVLKAALTDQDFFFKEEHPARRLIDILTKSGLEWDQAKGQDDPLFQRIKHNVDRVQQNFDREITIFSDVVSDLESFIKAEETASANALSKPIAQALQHEKISHATKVAKNEVALRIGTGEVVAFVEAFLENKWVSVLTLAYSIQNLKPQAVESAIRTMDDLVWSVKPKITQEQRKELIAKLPSMLLMLNKWLSVVKCEDADRLQFFAELAECHASIVRAPLEISPQRQLEIAIDVAKQAAERRSQLRANAHPEPEPDQFTEKTRTLERGAWLDFTNSDGTGKKVKLAWVSPLRSLFIFSTRERQEAFSITAENLAQAFRENRVQILQSGGLVGRALAEVLANPGANDATMAEQSAA
ncbi:MAG TPA: DUF1631 family protein [Burkholderiaceae bacterium]|nr:DUF1631 family protein [Burkholderiaceae bacterium]